ncbi:MAG: hypothetical protein Q9M91_06650 [Candidatus Dojkabacteria bacterium]|nr:hypothetical protein [Candidatus Dojkabacteria bacterium]MDQ7021475.1 hypothetical protein [Candidatus Dojkabacteria bacterium]
MSKILIVNDTTATIDALKNGLIKMDIAPTDVLIMNTRNCVEISEDTGELVLSAVDANGVIADLTSIDVVITNHFQHGLDITGREIVSYIKMESPDIKVVGISNFRELQEGEIPYTDHYYGSESKSRIISKKADDTSELVGQNHSKPQIFQT